MKITVEKIKNLLFNEGYHILVCSDSHLNRLSGISAAYSRADRSIKGLSLPDKYEIVINKSLNTKERVLTLIHELIHLLDEKLSEHQTERKTQIIYSSLSESDLGLFEFITSHSS